MAALTPAGGVVELVTATALLVEEQDDLDAVFEFMNDERFEPCGGGVPRRRCGRRHRDRRRRRRAARVSGGPRGWRRWPRRTAEATSSGVAIPCVRLGGRERRAPPRRRHHLGRARRANGRPSCPAPGPRRCRERPVHVTVSSGLIPALLPLARTGHADDRGQPRGARGESPSWWRAARVGRSASWLGSREAVLTLAA